jgi:hypothetical protein
VARRTAPGIGVVDAGGTRKFVGSEIKRWAEVVKSSGAKLDG